MRKLPKKWATKTLRKYLSNYDPFELYRFVVDERVIDCNKLLLESFNMLYRDMLPFSLAVRRIKNINLYIQIRKNLSIHLLGYLYLILSRVITEESNPGNPGKPDKPKTFYFKLMVLAGCDNNLPAFKTTLDIPKIKIQQWLEEKGFREDLSKNSVLNDLSVKDKCLMAAILDDVEFLPLKPSFSPADCQIYFSLFSFKVLGNLKADIDHKQIIIDYLKTSFSHQKLITDKGRYKPYIYLRDLVDFISNEEKRNRENRETFSQKWKIFNKINKSDFTYKDIYGDNVDELTFITYVEKELDTPQKLIRALSKK